MIYDKAKNMIQLYRHLKKINIPLLISALVVSLDDLSLLLITESFCELLFDRFGMLVPLLPSSLLKGRLGSTMPIVSALM